MSMRAFHDDQRTVLRVTGVDARPLLQDLVTNDLDRLAPRALVYAALLSPQGKYLFDFFLFEREGALMIDVAADAAEALSRRLSLYRLRRDMQISPTDLQVALVWGDGAAPDDAMADPRDARLGWRRYADDVAVTETDRSDYDALRVACAVPETGLELVPDESYVLEVGFERLNGVDFRKGCYVGQEVTARMKHKTTLRKGLARVRVGDGARPGAEVVAGGKPVGRLHTVAGDRALAYLRFDRAGDGMTADGVAVEMLSEQDTAV